MAALAAMVAPAVVVALQVMGSSVEPVQVAALATGRGWAVPLGLAVALDTVMFLEFAVVSRSERVAALVLAGERVRAIALG